MANWIDYPKLIFSRMATVIAFLIIGDRDIGKTYGLRKSCVEDWLKRKERFVEICRHASELQDVTSEYFLKLEEEREFPSYVFKTEANRAYIAKVVDEEGSEEWEMFGYFVALTHYQRLKKVTFSRVRKIILDEGTIDPDDNYHDYLPKEFKKLMNMVSTILREKPGVKTRGRLFILGNAVDFNCPYFPEFGITKPVDYGMHYHKNKTMMVYYSPPTDPEERMRETVVGQMLAGNKEAEVVFYNKFSNANMDYIENKTARAKFLYAIKFQSMNFAVWLDWRDGIMYINSHIPANSEDKTFSLTKDDNTVDNIIAKKNEDEMIYLRELYYQNLLRYESIGMRECFMKVLAYFGVR